MSAQPLDDDAPVTIATYPHPHEAELARAALESQGVPAVVQNDHGQYLSISSWVQLQVARQHREFADAVLERGPFRTAPPEDTPAPVRADDMRPLRLKRRFTLARWFLYASAVALFLTVSLTGPLFVIPLGLALWSTRNPRFAFGTAMAFQAVVVFFSIAVSGPPGLMALIPFLAYYVAFTVAVPEPPEQLLVSPAADSPTIEIGQEWKDGGATREPGEHSIWMLRIIGLFVFALIVLSALWKAVRFD